jgi:hypothetical protein
MTTGETVEVDPFTREKPWRIRMAEPVLEPCGFGCAVCGRDLAPACLVVQYCWFDREPARPQDTVLRTEMVCSEGCAIAFVQAGAPKSMSVYPTTRTAPPSNLPESDLEIEHGR